MSETQARYAAPPTTDGQLTPAELRRITARYGAMPDIKRLLESYTVLHYELEALKAATRAVDDEAYRNRFGSDE